MTSQRHLSKLSKFLSLVLRHRPGDFGLKVDEQGWASLARVVEVVQTHSHLLWADRSDVLLVARKGTQDGRKRFEIHEGRVRALYGHSFDVTIHYEPVDPPDTLCHGTSPEALANISRQGLKPMNRQHVHLSPDRETAFRIGLRHAERPVVIIVRAAAAQAAGVPFFRPEERIYLAGPIPPDYLEIPST